MNNLNNSQRKNRLKKYHNLKGKTKTVEETFFGKPENLVRRNVAMAGKIIIGNFKLNISVALTSIAISFFLCFVSLRIFFSVSISLFIYFLLYSNYLLCYKNDVKYFNL